MTETPERPSRQEIDFHKVEEHQIDIHKRLVNWGRWCNGSPISTTSPMFRMYQGSARARGDYGMISVVPVDSQDAAKIAKAVAALPQNHRAAVQWCYVKPVNPRRAAVAIGTTLAGLFLYLRDGRQMLINRKA